MGSFDVVSGFSHRLREQRRNYNIAPRPVDKFASEDEYMEQPLPEPSRRHTLHGAEQDVPVPGDSFGLACGRTEFIEPVDREASIPPPFDRLFHGQHPEECFAVPIVQLLAARFALSYEEVVARLSDAHGNPNLFLRDLADDYRQTQPHKVPQNSFGVVALEQYDPETYCLMTVTCPDYAATQRDEVLDVIHELVLSAAEIPVDTPRNRLVDRLLSDWTVESGERCRDLLDAHGLGVTDLVLLPIGDYSAQGFAVLNPISEETPNIGTGAAACSLDLRSGIHSRFRFHVERIADSVADHVVREGVHYGQPEHLLRQPYWFKPSYSVEEFLRFKERLLQPSSNIFEMRYAVMQHPLFGRRSYRNIVEMEKLRIAQFKHEKNHEDYMGLSNPYTHTGEFQASAATNSGGSGSMAHSGAEIASHGAGQRLVHGAAMQQKNDRLFGKFYKNNFH